MNETIERGELLRRGLLWGGAGAAALALAAPAAAVTRAKGDLELEVALIGDTLRLVPAQGDLAKGDLFGTAFLVKGNIYRTGTIGHGFDPRRRRGIGTWFCHGFLLSTPEQPFPDVLTTQIYALGASRAKRLFPPDQLASYGFEPHDGKQSPQRSVMGGAGRYQGAGGVVVQHQIGLNVTTVAAAGGIPAPNFKFVFDLR